MQPKSIDEPRLYREADESPPGDRPLIVRLRNWIGDVVLGVPALQLLAQRGYALELVGNDWARSLLAGYPWRVHVRPNRFWRRVSQFRALRGESVARDPLFDRRENAIILPTSFSSAFEMRLAGLHPVAYGMEWRSPLLARAESRPTEGHTLINYWELVCRFLRVDEPPPRRLELKLAAEDCRFADALLRRHGVASRFVCVCPFASDEEKIWPAFADLSRRLVARGLSVVASAGPGEEALIRGQHRGVIVLPEQKLGVYAALLRRAAMVVSNDTGPAHIAAAVGTPVLSIFGPTQPEIWAPWGDACRFICRWPDWPSVDEVASQVEPMLAAA